MKNAQTSFDRGYPITFARQRSTGGNVDIEALRKVIKLAREGDGIVGLPSNVEGVDTMPSNVDMQLLDALKQSPGTRCADIPHTRIAYRVYGR